MNVKTATGLVDRKGWPKGPWDHEADRWEWVEEIDEARYPCLIIRNPTFGALCGYVAVPPGHPLHGVDWRSDHPAAWRISELDAPINFSAACQEWPDDDLDEIALDGVALGGWCKELMVCHTPEPGDPVDVWWFGFDCAHAFDIAPAMFRAYEGLDMSDVLGTGEDWIKALATHGAKYRHCGWVIGVVRKVARQLHAMA